MSSRPDTPPASPELWGVKEVAEYIGVSPSTVRSYLARRHMPPPDFRPAVGSLWWAETIKKWHASRPSQKRELDG